MDTVIVVEIYVSLYRGYCFTVGLVQVVIEFILFERSEKALNVSVMFWCCK